MPRRQPPSSARPGERRRTPSTDVTSALLEAALELLREGGGDALTVRAVAARAGVAPMGVYSRFEGKQGLLEALFVQGFDRLHATLTAASGPDALSRLVSGCHAYRAFALANQHHYQLMFPASDKMQVGDEAMVRAAAAFGELESRVRDAMDARVLRAGDVTITAQAIWNSLHGAVALELAGIGFAPDPAEAFALTVRSVVDGLTVHG